MLVSRQNVIPEDGTAFRGRLREIVTDLGGPLALSRKSGVPQSSIQHYLRSGEPTRPVLVALARAGQVALRWLGEGLGPKGISANAADEPSAWDSAVKRIGVREILVGKLTFDFKPADESQPHGVYFGPVIAQLREDLLAATHGVEVALFGAVQVCGHEVEPHLTVGDWAIVNRADHYPNTGVYAFRTGSGITVARTMYFGGDELAVVSYDNARLYDLKLPDLKDRKVSILGRVVLGIRRISISKVSPLPVSEAQLNQRLEER